jgi:hypothetical protein
MSEPAWARPFAWRRHAGWFLFVVAASVLVWAITRNVVTGLVVFSLLCGCTQLFLDMWKAFRSFHPTWAPRSTRFSIGQVMVVTGLVAAYLGSLRALFTAYPIEDNGIVLMLSAFWFVLFAMFSGLGYTVWVRVKNVRAVLRGDRVPSDRNPRSRPPGKGDAKGGSPWGDRPGSRSAGS